MDRKYTLRCPECQYPRHGSRRQYSYRNKYRMALPNLDSAEVWSAVNPDLSPAAETSSVAYSTAVCLECIGCSPKGRPLSGCAVRCDKGPYKSVTTAPGGGDRQNSAKVKLCRKRYLVFLSLQTLLSTSVLRLSKR